MRSLCQFCFRMRRIVSIWGPPDLRLNACVSCDKWLVKQAQGEMADWIAIHQRSKV